MDASIQDSLDDKLARALALAVALRPRANLQALARSAGISKATLYRIAPTREDVFDLLLTREQARLREALERADLTKPPYAEALHRLIEHSLLAREFLMLWNTTQFQQRVESLQDDAFPHLFYSEVLEGFFLAGQKAGAFRVDMPAAWLAKACEYVLHAALESTQRGEIATRGMAVLVQRIFLKGASITPA